MSTQMLMTVRFVYYERFQYLNSRKIGFGRHRFFYFFMLSVKRMDRPTLIRVTFTSNLQYNTRRFSINGALVEMSDNCCQNFCFSRRLHM